MSKIPISKKVDGNELDLSMSELAIIPVKELIPLTKVSQLDLSCNKISKVPTDFCRLSNLVSLDLSNNFIRSLPVEISGLVRLRRLDLFKNQLTDLPLSFCYFKNLKWLDVKENPLNDNIKSIVGDCIDDNQCRKCSTNVVSHMKKMESEMQQKKQIDLKLQREQSKLDKIEEDKERKREKERKIVEKNERRLLFNIEKARKEEEAEEIAKTVELQENGDMAKVTQSKSMDTIKLKQLSLFTIFLIILFTGCCAATSVVLLCKSNTYTNDEFCIRQSQNIRDYAKLISDHFAKLMAK